MNRTSLGFVNGRYLSTRLMQVEQSISVCANQLKHIKKNSILNSDMSGKNRKTYYDSIRNTMQYNISEWAGTGRADALKFKKAKLERLPQELFGSTYSQNLREVINVYENYQLSLIRKNQAIMDKESHRHVLIGYERNNVNESIANRQIRLQQKSIQQAQAQIDSPEHKKAKHKLKEQIAKLTPSERKLFYKYIPARKKLLEEKRIIDFIKLETNFARTEINLNAGKFIRQKLKSLLRIREEIIKKLTQLTSK